MQAQRSSLSEQIQNTLLLACGPGCDESFETDETALS
jgi:hypothetical protein